MSIAEAIVTCVFIIAFFSFLSFLIFVMKLRSGSVPPRPTSTERLVDQFLNRPWPTWTYKHTVSYRASDTCGFCGCVLNDSELPRQCCDMCSANNVAPLVTLPPADPKEMN